MHEHREASRTSAQADRSGKVKYPSSGHVRFGGVGLRHITYETTEQRSGGFLGWAAEERARTKENDVQHDTYPTQSGIRVSQGLGGVRRTAQARKQEQFDRLIAHHLTVDLLRENAMSLLELCAAPGVDGVSWQANMSTSWRSSS